jgi:tryptophanyl-tRNA synthetase
MTTKSKQRILSGIQPSGKLHVGNYLGMLQNAVALQEEYETYYMIADLHSLSEDFEPQEKRRQIRELILDMLAAGIDPKQSVVFQQSAVLEHANLAVILNNFTYMGELERMTQFKDKALKDKIIGRQMILKKKQEGTEISREKITDKEYNEILSKRANIGLFDYPVLQAADILLYKPDAVPVGEDQRQHIELTRDLAKRFNNRFGETFPVPKGLYTKTPRVMSILDPEKKMSKSLGDSHCVYLSDEPEIIRKKLAKALTATDSKSKDMPAGVKNLFLLLKNFGSENEYKKFETKYQSGSIKYQELKEVLAKSVAKFFAPFREKRKQLAENLPAVEKILAQGAEKASAKASITLDEVRAKLGLK